MAKVLDDLPISYARRQKYPWAEWTDGRAWEIRQGEDYDVKSESMRLSLANAAARKGMKVRTRRVSENGEWVGIQFQFYARNGDA